MNDITYNALCKYLHSLKLRGYVKDSEVFKILYLTAINKIVFKYFPGYITEDDYRIIEKSLYKVFGFTYLIPYPQFCNYNTMDKFHANDATDLINAITHQIEEQNINMQNFQENINQDIDKIKSTKVLKSNSENEIFVDDIIIN